MHLSKKIQLAILKAVLALNPHSTQHDFKVAIEEYKGKM